MPAGGSAGEPAGEPAGANKDVVRRYYDAAWSGGDLSVVDDLVSPGYRPGGPAGEKQLIAGARAAFPDLRYILEDVLAAEGNTVVVRWTAQGTHLGRFRGIAPRGTEVSWSGITIYRLAAGRLVSGWSRSQQLGLLRQLGATILPPGGDPAPGRPAV
jgi:predicted ester cyclase